VDRRQQVGRSTAQITVTREARPATALFDEAEIRIDGRDKVSGKTQFTADVHRPNMLWAAYATSPHAYARVRSVDTAAARAVPGVKAVLTAADIGPLRFGRQVFDWPVLAYDVVRFIGDRVAAVAAETREAAEEAARRIEVAYDELEPVLTPAAALAPDAPVLHPEWPDYHYLAYQNAPRPGFPAPNMHAWSVLEKGSSDLDALFAGAHRVYEHRFETPRQHCGYIEPHATLVWIDDDGTVHVHSPNKSPFALRMQLAHVTGTPVERIVVETNAIGGDFGGKGLTVDEFPCFFLAKATGRPVRRVQTYSDELQGMTTRHRAYVTLKTAVDEHGKFIAHRSEMLYDGGAYAAGKPMPSLLQAVGYGTVPYQVPNVRLDIRSVYTNTIPAAHMRSPADVQTYFAWEQHVDIIAQDLGIDPIEFRMLNVIRDGDTALTGELVRAPRAYAVLDALRQNARWDEPLPAGRARGVALVCRHTGHGKTSLRLRLTPAGRIEVVTGVPDQGSGGHTVIRRVVAAVLSVAPERVDVRRGNTAEAELDPGAGASRVTHVVGGAAKNGAERLRERIEREWGLTLRDDAFVDPQTGKTEPFGDVAARHAALEVSGAFDGDYHDPADPGDYSCSAFCLDVDVDRDTGAFRILDALLVAEVGQIINPTAHQGQLDGGFIYGIGGALMEEMPIDESGKIGTLSLGEYKLPTMMDIPPLRTVLVQAGPAKGPYGAKMAGELSNSGVAPALVNAICRAAGVRIKEFPVTSERIYQALSLTHRTEAS
jgi:carbon-monoxide dehydrogenase large subunit